MTSVIQSMTNLCISEQKEREMKKLTEIFPKLEQKNSVNCNGYILQTLNRMLEDAKNPDKTSKTFVDDVQIYSTPFIILRRMFECGLGVAKNDVYAKKCGELVTQQYSIIIDIMNIKMTEEEALESAAVAKEKAELNVALKPIHKTIGDQHRRMKELYKGFKDDYVFRQKQFTCSATKCAS
jgi:hypothetical protein